MNGQDDIVNPVCVGKGFHHMKIFFYLSFPGVIHRDHNKISLFPVKGSDYVGDPGKDFNLGIRPEFTRSLPGMRTLRTKGGNGIHYIHLC